jgi:hypothetical protein
MKSGPSLTLLAAIVTTTTLLAYSTFSVNGQQSSREIKIVPLNWEYKVIPLSQLTWAREQSCILPVFHAKQESC